MKKYLLLFYWFFSFSFFSSKENTPKVKTYNNENLYELIKLNYKKKKWKLFHKNRIKFLKTDSCKLNKKKYTKVLEYSGAYFRHQNKQDSAFYYYYKSYKEFIELKDSINIAKMLLNLAIIQKNSRDYLGSESSTFQALFYLKNSKKNRWIASLYNNLGIVYNYSEDYKNSLHYHFKALALREKINGQEKLVLHSLNNIGNVYNKLTNYNDAVFHYKKGLNNLQLLKSNPKVHSMLLDNLGYTYLLEKNHQELPKLFFNALKIRDSITDLPGKIRSYLHLGNYYQSINKRSDAILYYEKALKTSKQIHNIQDEIEVLGFLSNVYSEKKAPPVLKRILYLKDSLFKNDRKVKQQFTRIQYETEEKEKENLQLKTQNAEQALLTQKANTQKWLFALGLLLVAITAFFLWRRYKAEAKAKQLINKQKNLVETLQKELHHRMKNNLSFIDLFINLAKTKFQDQAYQTKLNELQNRMRSMFEIHKQLFRKEDVTIVNAKKYIDVLVENVQKAYSKNNISIFNTTENKENLLADISFPFGLIINEFVTNSYKYAFDYNELGKISISLTSDHSNYHLSLADNGKGLPTDFNIDDLDSFGMETIQLLTKEYKGTFLLENSKGVKMKISLPKTAVLL